MFEKTKDRLKTSAVAIKTKEHLGENKPAYLAGVTCLIAGLLIGMASRSSAKISTNVTVVLGEAQ